MTSLKKLLLFGGINKLAVYRLIVETFLNNGLVAYWPFDESSGNFSRVINPGVAIGRNLTINGTFDADASWTKGTGWTITGGTAVATAALAAATLSQVSPTISLVMGRSYLITYDVVVTTGSVKVQVGSSGNGTTRSTSGTYSETIVCAGSTSLLFNPVSTFTGTIDNVTIQEMDATLMTNGLFDNWTGGFPDNFTHSTNTANSVVSQVGSGESKGGAGTGSLNIWTDNNTNTGVTQANVTVIGQRYTYVMVISALTGEVAISDGNVAYATFTTTGTKIGSFVASSTSINIKRGASTTDATVDSLAIIPTTVISANSFGVNGGIELATNGNFDNWTGSTPTGWTKTTTTASSEVQQVGSGASHGGVGTGAVNIWTNDNTNTGITLANATVLGHTYMVTMVISALTGSIAISDGTLTYTTFSSVGTKNVKIVATGTSFNIKRGSATTDVTIDSVSIIETDQMTGVNTAVSIAQPVGRLNKAYSFDGTNSVVNIYSASLNSAINPAEGTVMAFARVSALGVWSDAVGRQILRLAADNNNLIKLLLNTSANSIQGFYIAGSTSKSVSFTTSALSFFHIALTWSIAADEVKLYFNGVQVGSTQTGLGTWAGNLITTQTVVGGSTSTPNLPWSGLEVAPAIFNRPLTAAEILNIASKGGVA